MNNIPKVLVMIALGVLYNNAMADWRADAANLDQNSGLNTTHAIESARNDLAKYQPPQPCMDKNPETFNLDAPAALACGGGASGGGAGGGTGGAGGAGGVGGGAGGGAIQGEQTGSGTSFDHM